MMSYISLVSWYCNHDLSPVEPQELISHHIIIIMITYHNHNHHHIWSYLILSDPIWSYLMFDDDDYLWYLIHWMFHGYSGYSGYKTSIFGQKTKTSRDCHCSGLQELELRCDALEQRKQQLGCPGAENVEPMNQFLRFRPEIFVPNFHDISTWKRNAKLAEFEV